MITNGFRRKSDRNNNKKNIDSPPFLKFYLFFGSYIFVCTPDLRMANDQ